VSTCWGQVAAQQPNRDRPLSWGVGKPAEHLPPKHQENGVSNPRQRWNTVAQREPGPGSGNPWAQRGRIMYSSSLLFSYSSPVG
jgi:hypothetical protein